MGSASWDNTLNHRVTRRRALALTGGFTAGAAFLAACGGSKDSQGPVDNSGLLTRAVDTTKQAKPGGTWTHFVTSEVTTMDPLKQCGVWLRCQ